MPDFPVNAGALCLKGFTAGETLAHPDRLVAPLVRNAAGHLVRGRLGRGARPRRLRRAAAAAQVRARRDRRVRRRLAHQREGLSARQVRPRRPAHAEHRLQRPLLHVVGRRGRACARSASIAACRSRSPTSPHADAILLVGANVAETMPPIMQYFDAQRRGRRAVDRRRSAPHRDGAAGDAAPAADSGHRRHPGARPAARADSRAADRRRLHPRAHRGIRGGPRPRRDATGPSASSA